MNKFKMFSVKKTFVCSNNKINVQNCTEENRKLSLSSNFSDNQLIKGSTMWKNWPKNLIGNLTYKITELKK